MHLKRFTVLLLMLKLVHSVEENNTRLELSNSLVDDDSLTKAVEPLYSMTKGWLEIVQPSEKGSVLKTVGLGGEIKLYFYP